MRKLKLQMQISIDGFVSAGPNDEQKWVTWAWEEIRGYVLELFDSSDTTLIGRKLADGYIPYWQGVSENPDDPMYEVGKRIAPAKKIVFSKTLSQADAAAKNWNNTIVASGNIADEVNKLKKQPGKDLIVYGGNTFVSALIKERLIDEFNLFVNPVALGRGDGIFNQLKDHTQLHLKNSITYPSGIVLLKYNL